MSFILQAHPIAMSGVVGEFIFCAILCWPPPPNQVNMAEP